MWRVIWRKVDTVPPMNSWCLPYCLILWKTVQLNREHFSFRLLLSTSFPSSVLMFPSSVDWTLSCRCTFLDGLLLVGNGERSHVWWVDLLKTSLFQLEEFILFCSYTKNVHLEVSSSLYFAKVKKEWYSFEFTNRNDLRAFFFYQSHELSFWSWQNANLTTFCIFPAII